MTNATGIGSVRVESVGEYFLESERGTVNDYFTGNTRAIGEKTREHMLYPPRDHVSFWGHTV